MLHTVAAPGKSPEAMLLNELYLFFSLAEAERLACSSFDGQDGVQMWSDQSDGVPIAIHLCAFSLHLSLAYIAYSNKMDDMLTSGGNGVR